MTTSTSCQTETSLTHKDSISIERATISSADITIMSLATTFQVRSMLNVHFKRTRVTMQETPGATTRRTVSLDLITMVWCKTKPNSERTTVVSMLIRRKDSTVRVSNTQTSSLIALKSQTIRISRMRRTSPEETRNTKTATLQWVEMSSTRLQRRGSREILRSIRSSWTNQQPDLRISLSRAASPKPRTAMSRMQPRPQDKKDPEPVRKKKTWWWQSYEEWGRNLFVKT